MLLLRRIARDAAVELVETAFAEQHHVVALARASAR